MTLRVSSVHNSLAASSLLVVSCVNDAGRGRDAGGGCLDCDGHMNVSIHCYFYFLFRYLWGVV